MGTGRGAKRRGSALIEFTIAAVPVIFVTLSIIEMSLESWKFETMVYAIEVAARYACAHGRTCTKNGNACTITVGNVATDRKSTRLNSSHRCISYAVFCLK